MRMRPTHGAAAVFAATLAATVGSSGPAKAFFFLPIFQQSQSSFESKSGRSPGDNSRWRGGDRGRDEAAQPKPSTGTRAKRDEEKSSSTSSDKGGKSQAKSEASSSQASRTRSVRQEPPPVRAAAASAPRCAEKAPRLEAVRRPPRSRSSSPAQTRTPPRRRPVPPAPAAPSAIPTTRSSARCSRRGLTSSSSSRINRVQRLSQQSRSQLGEFAMSDKTNRNLTGEEWRQISGGLFFSEEAVHAFEDAFEDQLQNVDQMSALNRKAYRSEISSGFRDLPL